MIRAVFLVNMVNNNLIGQYICFQICRIKGLQRLVSVLATHQRKCDSTLEGISTGWKHLRAECAAVTLVKCFPWVSS